MVYCFRYNYPHFYKVTSGDNIGKIIGLEPKLQYREKLLQPDMSVIAISFKAYCYANIIEQDVFVKHECPRNGLFFF